MSAPTIQNCSVPLSTIKGLSRYNARRNAAHEVAEIEELAASIVANGLIEPLLLFVEDGETGAERRVLDGGRRLLALQLLDARGCVSEPIACAIFDGAPEQAAEVSLMSFLHRRDLHPVDEFERFNELAETFGLSAPQIALKIGKTERFVKDRLRLGRLCPRVRALWRSGQLSADQARAFAANADLAAQESLLDRLPNLRAMRPQWIADELAKDSLAARDSICRLVGKDSYVAAGGELDEQLFESDDRFLDGDLVRRLAAEQLDHVGKSLIDAESWGFFVHELQPEFNPLDFMSREEYDFREEEKSRCDEIAELLVDASEEETRALEREQAEITTRALLRALSKVRRAQLGVVIEIGDDGALEILRACARRVDSDKAPQDSAASATKHRHKSDKTEKPPFAAPEKQIGERVKTLLDDAASAALSDACRDNLSLALCFLLAGLVCRDDGGFAGLPKAAYKVRDFRSSLLRRVDQLEFSEVLPLVLAAHREDATALPLALAELVGACIETHEESNFDHARLLLSAAETMAALRERLRQSFDYEKFFDLHEKPFCLEAVAAMGGDAEHARKLKREAAAEFAARLARDKAWLPNQLKVAPLVAETAAGEALEPGASDPTAETASLAAAMADAINADEQAESNFEARLAPWREDAEHKDLALFLLAACRPAGQIAPRPLHRAFKDHAAQNGARVWNEKAFKAMMAEMGFPMKLDNNGAHQFTGLSLRGEGGVA